jgi:hypothetical protein
MQDGYVHGAVQCRLCFDGSNNTLALGEWRLQNGPGYWGSSDPAILVLGFSKGANQNKAAQAGDFDKIAFAQARQRLKAVLEALKLMPSDRDIDALMTARERVFGFASLVRCSLHKVERGRQKTSGNIIPSAFANPSTQVIISRCAGTFLGKLPNRVRLVVLLGTNNTYLAATQAVFRRLYTEYQAINPVSFRAGNALWIYAAHPSPGNGHFNSWVSGGTDNASGRKRMLALEALDGAALTR